MQGEDLNIYIDVVEDLKKLLMVWNTNLFLLQMVTAYPSSQLL